MQRNGKIETTSCQLHIAAMVLMLCDHLWGTVVPGNDWLTCIGRLSFPIFAFLLVEGFFHTRDLKKYALRLLIAAILSEIPFNLAMGSRLVFPIHQNVLWSFLISLGLMRWNEKAAQTGKLWRRMAVGAASVLLGSLLGLVTMADYYHAGILTVLVFYFFRKRSWLCRLGQLLCLWYIHAELLGGLGYEVEILGSVVFITRQSLALLALIPIWLYRGNQGSHGKFLRWLYYGFYPAHLLILGLIKMIA